MAKSASDTTAASGSSFTGKLLTVLGGSSFSTILPVAVSPVLSRLFDASSGFAPFAFFMSSCYLVAAVANSHYTTAILVADREEESRDVFQLSTWINLLIAAVLLGFCLFGAWPLMNWFHAPEGFVQLIWLVPVQVFFMGIYANLLQWNFRKEQFRRISFSRMFQSLVTVLIQLIAGWYHWPVNGLILGMAGGQLVALIALAFLTLRDDRHLMDFPHPKQLKASAAQYRMFLQFQTVADLINVFTQQLPTFLLGRFGFIREMGWFGFANRVLIAPSSIVTGAIGDVFRQQAAADYRETGSALLVFHKTTKLLLGVMVVPSLATAIWGPDLFRLLFGAEWYNAGEYARILIIMLFPKFIVSPLSYMYIIARKQQEDAWLHLLILLLTGGALYAGFQITGTAAGMLLYFSVAYAIIYLIYYIRSFTFAKGTRSAEHD